MLLLINNEIFFVIKNLVQFENFKKLEVNEFISTFNGKPLKLVWRCESSPGRNV